MLSIFSCVRHTLPLLLILPGCSSKFECISGPRSNDDRVAEKDAIGHDVGKLS